MKRRDSSASPQNDKIGDGLLSQGGSLKQFFVYIMSNKSRTLYTGVTSDLLQRVYQHKQKLVPGFTFRYNVTQLVYFEEGTDATGAISREKQLKRWRRDRKIALIEAGNPGWDDLSEGWYV